MKQFYKNIIWFSLLFSGFLRAQEERAQEIPYETSCFDSWMLPDYEHGEREATISAQHREANGIGYNRGYSSLDFFWNIPSRCEVHPFIDLRGHISNDGFWAANVGLGMRRYFYSKDTVFGANVFYDYRNAPHIGFHQIGGGLEAFGCRWDFHLNGYFPIGRKKKLFHDGFYKFKNHRALFQKRYEISMTGGEVGIGYEIVRGDYVNLHTKIGGYYFHGQFHKQTVGGLFRLKSDITPYFSIEGQVSYDSLFKDIYQGMASLNWSIGTRAEKNTIYSCNRRAMQMVDRFEMIVAKKHREKSPAIDPVTAKPLNFIFVNNTSSSSGTFKSPFPTLVQAQNASNPGDVIYVFPGNGTTTGMNQGFNLQDRQQLIGSGAPSSFLTRFGLRTIPAQTQTLPTITASANVIAFSSGATNNVISGFNIIHNTVGIFYGAAAPIQNLTVINNSFTDLSGTGFGVEITNPIGNILIANNIFSPTGTTGTAFEALWSNLTLPGTTNVQLQLFNNQINAGTGFSIQSNVTGFLSNAQINVDISYNTFQVSSAPVSFTNITFIQTHSSIKSNLVFKNNVSSGGMIEMIMSGVTPGQVQSNMVVHNNRVQNVTGNPSLSVSETDSFVTMDMQNNQFLNATNSVEILVSGHLALNLVNNNSTTLNNVAEGFFIDNVGAFAITVISPNGMLSGVAAQNTGSSPLTNSDTTIGPITTAGSIDYEVPQ